jgi:hypothetical protein
MPSSKTDVGIFPPYRRVRDRLPVEEFTMRRAAPGEGHEWNTEPGLHALGPLLPMSGDEVLTPDGFAGIARHTSLGAPLIPADCRYVVIDSDLPVIAYHITHLRPVTS